MGTAAASRFVSKDKGLLLFDDVVDVVEEAKARTQGTEPACDSKEKARNGATETNVIDRWWGYCENRTFFFGREERRQYWKETTAKEATKVHERVGGAVRVTQGDYLTRTVLVPGREEKRHMRVI